MNLTVTLVIIGVAIVATVFCGWRGAQPKDYAKPRRIPWQLLMLVCAFVVLIMFVHLISLFGFGPPQSR